MKVVGDLFGSGRDAAAVRAAVRRDDEDRRRLPRAAHGEGRQPAARARSCSPPSRATCTTSARTSSTSSSPTTATRSTTSASRSPISEMIDKALEVEADAIGMSGLLVKSTLIMRENLEELNERGLADRCRCCSAARRSTRNYVEVDLREIYDGRVFYGKDAFEGLRTMDTLMEGKRTGSLDPDVRTRARAAASCRRARASERGPDVEIPARSDVADRRAGVHAAVRRVARRQGHLPRRDRRLHQRDRAVPQPVAVPSRQDRDRERRRVQGTHPPDAARASSTPRSRGPARAERWRGATSR